MQILEEWDAANIDEDNAELQRGAVRTPLPFTQEPFTLGPFTQADGSLKLNTNYFTAVELTHASPQVVTFTINPKAVWSDGAHAHVWNLNQNASDNAAGLLSAVSVASVNSGTLAWFDGARVGVYNA